MEPRARDDTETATLLLLGSLIAAACVAGIAPIVDTVAPVLARDAIADAPASAPACRSCGVVESLRELDTTLSQREFSTVAGGRTEGAVFLLAALSGMRNLKPAKIHEVSVRMEDGSLRCFRSAAPPAFKPGDPVKVLMGTVRPVS